MSNFNWQTNIGQLPDKFLSTVSLDDERKKLKAAERDRDAAKARKIDRMLQDRKRLKHLGRKRSLSEDSEMLKTGKRKRPSSAPEATRPDDGDKIGKKKRPRTSGDQDPSKSKRQKRDESPQSETTSGTDRDISRYQAQAKPTGFGKLSEDNESTQKGGPRKDGKELKPDIIRGRGRGRGRSKDEVGVGKKGPAKKTERDKDSDKYATAPTTQSQVRGRGRGRGARASTSDRSPGAGKDGKGVAGKGLDSIPEDTGSRGKSGPDRDSTSAKGRGRGKAGDVGRDGSEGRKGHEYYSGLTDKEKYDRVPTAGRGRGRGRSDGAGKDGPGASRKDKDDGDPNAARGRGKADGAGRDGPGESAGLTDKDGSSASARGRGRGKAGDETGGKNKDGKVGSADKDKVAKEGPLGKGKAGDSSKDRLGVTTGKEKGVKGSLTDKDKMDQAAGVNYKDGVSPTRTRGRGRGRGGPESGSKERPGKSDEQGKLDMDKGKIPSSSGADADGTAQVRGRGRGRSDPGSKDRSGKPGGEVDKLDADKDKKLGSPLSQEGTDGALDKAAQGRGRGRGRGRPDTGSENRLGKPGEKGGDKSPADAGLADKGLRPSSQIRGRGRGKSEDGTGRPGQTKGGQKDKDAKSSEEHDKDKIDVGPGKEGFLSPSKIAQVRGRGRGRPDSSTDRPGEIKGGPKGLDGEKDKDTTAAQKSDKGFLSPSRTGEIRGRGRGSADVAGKGRPGETKEGVSTKETDKDKEGFDPPSKTAQARGRGRGRSELAGKDQPGGTKYGMDGKPVTDGKDEDGKAGLDKDKVESPTREGFLSPSKTAQVRGRGRGRAELTGKEKPGETIDEKDRAAKAERPDSPSKTAGVGGRGRGLDLAGKERPGEESKKDKEDRDKGLGSPSKTAQVRGRGRGRSEEGVGPGGTKGESKLGISEGPDKGKYGESAGREGLTSPSKTTEIKGRGRSRPEIASLDRPGATKGELKDKEKSDKAKADEDAAREGSKMAQVRGRGRGRSDASTERLGDMKGKLPGTLDEKDKAGSAGLGREDSPSKTAQIRGRGRGRGKDLDGKERSGLGIGIDGKTSGADKKDLADVSGKDPSKKLLTGADGKSTDELEKGARPSVIRGRGRTKSVAQPEIGRPGEGMGPAKGTDVDGIDVKKGASLHDRSKKEPAGADKLRSKMDLDAKSKDGKDGKKGIGREGSKILSEKIPGKDKSKMLDTEEGDKLKREKLKEGEKGKGMQGGPGKAATGKDAEKKLGAESQPNLQKGKSGDKLFDQARKDIPKHSPSEILKRGKSKEGLKASALDGKKLAEAGTVKREPSGYSPYGTGGIKRDESKINMQKAKSLQGITSATADKDKLAKSSQPIPSQERYNMIDLSQLMRRDSAATLRSTGTIRSNLSCRSRREERRSRMAPKEFRIVEPPKSVSYSKPDVAQRKSPYDLEEYEEKEIRVYERERQPMTRQKKEVISKILALSQLDVRGSDLQRDSEIGEGSIGSIESASTLVSTCHSTRSKCSERRSQKTPKDYRISEKPKTAESSSKRDMGKSASQSLPKRSASEERYRYAIRDSRIEIRNKPIELSQLFTDHTPKDSSLYRPASTRDISKSSQKSTESKRAVSEERPGKSGQYEKDGKTEFQTRKIELSQLDPGYNRDSRRGSIQSTRSTASTVSCRERRLMKDRDKPKPDPAVKKAASKEKTSDRPASSPSTLDRNKSSSRTFDNAAVRPTPSDRATSSPSTLDRSKNRSKTFDKAADRPAPSDRVTPSTLDGRDRPTPSDRAAGRSRTLDRTEDRSRTFDLSADRSELFARLEDGPRTSDRVEDRSSTFDRSANSRRTFDGLEDRPRRHSNRFEDSFGTFDRAPRSPFDRFEDRSGTFSPFADRSRTFDLSADRPRTFGRAPHSPRTFDRFEDRSRTFDLSADRPKTFGGIVDDRPRTLGRAENRPRSLDRPETFYRAADRSGTFDRDEVKSKTFDETQDKSKTFDDKDRPATEKDLVEVKKAADVLPTKTSTKYEEEEEFINTKTKLSELDKSVKGIPKDLLPKKISSDTDAVTERASRLLKREENKFPEKAQIISKDAEKAPEQLKSEGIIPPQTVSIPTRDADEVIERDLDLLEGKERITPDKVNIIARDDIKVDKIHKTPQELLEEERIHILTKDDKITDNGPEALKKKKIPFEKVSVPTTDDDTGKPTKQLKEEDGKPSKTAPKIEPALISSLMKESESTESFDISKYDSLEGSKAEDHIADTSTTTGKEKREGVPIYKQIDEFEDKEAVTRVGKQYPGDDDFKLQQQFKKEGIVFDTKNEEASSEDENKDKAQRSDSSSEYYGVLPLDEQISDTEKDKDQEKNGKRFKDKEKEERRAIPDKMKVEKGDLPMKEVVIRKEPTFLESDTPTDFIEPKELVSKEDQVTRAAPRPLEDRTLLEERKIILKEDSESPETSEYVEMTEEKEEERPMGECQAICVLGPSKQIQPETIVDDIDLENLPLDVSEKEFIEPDSPKETKILIDRGSPEARKKSILEDRVEFADIVEEKDEGRMPLEDLPRDVIVKEFIEPDTNKDFIKPKELVSDEHKVTRPEQEILKTLEKEQISSVLLKDNVESAETSEYTNIIKEKEKEEIPIGKPIGECQAICSLVPSKKQPEIISDTTDVEKLSMSVSEKEYIETDIPKDFIKQKELVSKEDKVIRAEPKLIKDPPEIILDTMDLKNLPIDASEKEFIQPDIPIEPKILKDRRSSQEQKKIFTKIADSNILEDDRVILKDDSVESAKIFEFSDIKEEKEERKSSFGRLMTECRAICSLLPSKQINPEIILDVVDLENVPRNVSEKGQQISKIGADQICDEQPIQIIMSDRTETVDSKYFPLEKIVDSVETATSKTSQKLTLSVDRPILMKVESKTRPQDISPTFIKTQNESFSSIVFKDEATETKKADHKCIAACRNAKERPTVFREETGGIVMGNDTETPHDLVPPGYYLPDDMTPRQLMPQWANIPETVISEQDNLSLSETTELPVSESDNAIWIVPTPEEEILEAPRGISIPRLEQEWETDTEPFVEDQDQFGISDKIKMGNVMSRVLSGQVVGLPLSGSLLDRSSPHTLSEAIYQQKLSSKACNAYCAKKKTDKDIGEEGPLETVEDVSDINTDSEFTEEFYDSQAVTEFAEPSFVEATIEADFNDSDFYKEAEIDEIVDPVEIFVTADSFQPVELNTVENLKEASTDEINETKIEKTAVAPKEILDTVESNMDEPKKIDSGIQDPKHIESNMDEPKKIDSGIQDRKHSFRTVQFKEDSKELEKYVISKEDVSIELPKNVIATEFTSNKLDDEFQDAPDFIIEMPSSQEGVVAKESGYLVEVVSPRKSVSLSNVTSISSQYHEEFVDALSNLEKDQFKISKHTGMIKYQQTKATEAVRKVQEVSVETAPKKVSARYVEAIEKMPLPRQVKVTPLFANWFSQPSVFSTPIQEIHSICTAPCAQVSRTKIRTTIADKSVSSKPETEALGTSTEVEYRQTQRNVTTSTVDIIELTNCLRRLAEPSKKICRGKCAQLNQDEELQLLRHELTAKEAYCAEQRKIATAALEQLENIKNIVEERDDLRKKLQTSQYELADLKKNLESMGFGDVQTADKKKSEVYVPFKESTSSLTNSCDEDIMVLEDEITKMRSSCLSPEQETKVIKKEVEVLKRYCTKLSSIQEENAVLKKQNMDLQHRCGEAEEKLQLLGCEDKSTYQDIQNKLLTLNETTAERNVLQNRVRQLETELNAYQDLPEDIELFKRRSLLLDDVLKDRDRLAKRVEQMRGIDDEIVTLKNKAERVDELERQLRLATKDVQIAEDDLDSMRNKCTMAEIELLNHKTETDTLRSKIICMEHENESLKSMCKEQEVLQIEKERLQSSLDELVRMQDDYEHMCVQMKALDVLKAEKDRYKRKYEDLVGLEGECKILRDQLDKAKMIEVQKDALERQTEDLEKCICEQEDEIRRLVTHIDCLAKGKEDQQHKMKEVVSNLKTELEKKESLLILSEEQITTMKVKIDSSFQDLSDETKNLRHKNKNLEKEISTLKSVNDDLQHKLRKTEAQNMNIVKELENKNHIVETMQDVLKDRETCQVDFDTIINNSQEINRLKNELAAAKLENQQLQEYATKTGTSNQENNQQLRQMLDQSKTAVERIALELERQYADWDCKKRYRCCPGCNCKKKNKDAPQPKVIIRCCAGCNCKNKTKKSINNERAGICGCKRGAKSVDSSPRRCLCTPRPVQQSESSQSPCQCKNRKTAASNTVRTSKKTDAETDLKDLLPMWHCFCEPKLIKEHATDPKPMDCQCVGVGSNNEDICDYGHLNYDTEDEVDEDQMYTARCGEESKAKIAELEYELLKANDTIAQLKEKITTDERLAAENTALRRHSTEVQVVAKDQIEDLINHLKKTKDRVAELEAKTCKCNLDKRMKRLQELNIPKEIIEIDEIPDANTVAKFQADLGECLKEKERLLKLTENLKNQLEVCEKGENLPDQAAFAQLKTDLEDCLREKEKLLKYIDDQAKQIRCNRNFDQSSIDKLKSELKQCLREKEILSQQIDDLEQQNHLNKYKEQSNMDKLRADLQQCLEEKEKLIKQINDLEKQLHFNKNLEQSSINKLRGELEKDLKEKDTEMKKLFDELKKGKDKNGETEARNCKLKFELLKCQKQLKELGIQKDISDSEEILVGKLQSDFEKCLREKDKLLQQNDALKEQLESNKNQERQNINKQRTELENCLKEREFLNNKIGELEKRLKEKESEMKKIDHDLKNAKDKFNEAQERNCNLKFELLKCQKRLQELQADFEECIKEKENMLNQIDSLNKQLDSKKAKDQSNINDLRAELEQCLTRKESEIENLIRELKKAKDKVGEVEARNCRLKFELLKCQKRLQELQKERLAEGEVQTLSRGFNSTDECLGEDLPDIAAFAKLKTELEKCLKEKENLLKMIDSLQNQLNQLSSGMTEDLPDMVQFARLESELKDCLGEKENLLNQIKALKEQLASCKIADPSDLETLKSDLDKKLTDYEALCLCLEHQLASGTTKDLPDMAAFAQLKSELDKSLKEKENLLQQLAALKQQLDAFNAAEPSNLKESKSDMCAALKQQLESMKAEDSAELEKLKSELDKCLKEKENLLQELAALKKQLASCKIADPSDLEKLKSDVEKKLPDIEALCVCVEDQQSGTTKDLPDMAAFAQLKAELDKSLKEKENLLQQLAALKQQLDTINATEPSNLKESKSDMCAALKQQLESMKAEDSAELAKLKSELDKCLKDKEELLKMIENLQNNLTSTDLPDMATFAKQKAELDNALKEKENLLRELAALKQQLESTKSADSAELAKLKSELDKCLNDKEGLLKTIGDLQAQLKSGIPKEITDGAAFAKLKAELDDCLKEKENLLKQLAGLKQQLDSIHTTDPSELEKLKSDLERSLKEKEVLSKMIEGLQNQMTPGITKDLPDMVAFANLKAKLDECLKEKDALLKMINELKMENDKLKKEKNDLDNMLMSNVAVTSKRSSKLENELDIISNENKKLTAENQKLDKTNKDLANKNQELLQQLAALMKENESLKKQLENQKKELNELLEKLKQPSTAPAITKAQLDKDQKDKDALQAIIDDLENQLKNLSTKEKGKPLEQSDDLKKKIDQLSKQLDEAQKRAEAAENALRNLKASDPTAMLNAEMQKLKERLAQLEKENASLKDALAQANNAKAALQKDLDNALNDVKHIKEEYNALKKSTDNLRSENENLKTDLQKMKDDASGDSAFKAENERLKKRIAQLESEDADLKKELDHARAESKKSAERINQLMSENGDLRKKLVQMEGENSKLKKDLEAALADAKKTADKLLQSEQDTSKCKQTVKDLENEVARLKKELDGMLNDAKKNANTVSDLQKEIAGLKQKISQLESINAKLDDENSKVKKELEQARSGSQAVAALQDEKNKLQKQNAGLQSENDKLKKELENALADAKSKLLTASQLQDEVGNLKKRLQQLEAENNDLKKKLAAALVDSKKSDLQESYDKLRQKLADIENENSKLKKDLQNALDENKKLKEELNELKQSEKKCKDKIAQLEGDNSNLKKSLNTALDDLKKIGTEITAIQNDESKLKQKVALLETENGKLKKDLESALESARKATGDASTLKDENSKLKQRIAQLESENAKLKADIDSNANQLKKTSDQVKLLQDENNKLKQKITQLEDENGKLKQKLDTIAKEAKSTAVSDDGAKQRLEDELDKLKKELNGVKNEARDYNKELTQLKDENNRLKQKISQLEAENKKLKSDLDKSTNAAKAAESELAKLKDNEAKLKDKIAQLNNDIGRLQKEKSSLAEDMKKAGSDLEKLSELKDSENKLKQKIAQLEAENAKLKKDLDAALNDNKRLAEDLANNKNENAKMKQELAKLEGDNKKLKKDLDNAVTDAKKGAAGVVDLKEVDDKLKQRIAQLESENARLKAELDNALDSAKKAASDLSKLRDEDNKLKQKVAQLEGENSKIKKDLEKALADAKSSASQATDLRNENNKLKQKIPQLESEIANLRKELEAALNDAKNKATGMSKLQDEINNLKQKNAQLEKESDKLKKDLEAVKKDQKAESDSGKKIRDENNKQKQKISQLEDELAKLKKELAMAATAPVPTTKAPDDDDKRKQLEQLNNENAKLKKELENAQKEAQNLAGLQNENMKLKQQVSKLQNEIDKLKNDLNAAINEAKKNAAELSKTKENESKCKQRIAQLETENLKLKKDLDDAVNKAEETNSLRNENKKLKDQIKQLNEEINKLKSALAAVDTKKGPVDETKEFKDEIAKLKQRIANLETENAKLKQQYDGAKRDLEQLKGENGKLKGENQKLQTDLKASKNQDQLNKELQVGNIDDLEKQIKDYESKIKQLEAELKKQKKECEDNIKSLKAQFDRDIKNLLKKNDDNIDKLQKESADLMKDLNEKHGREIKGLRDAINQLRAELEAALRENEKLKNLLDDQKRKSIDIKDKVLEVEKVINKERRKSKDLEKKHSELKSKTSEIEEEKEDLSKKLEQTIRKKREVEQETESLKTERDTLTKEKDALKVESDELKKGSLILQKTLDAEKRKSKDLESNIELLKEQLDTLPEEFEIVQMMGSDKRRSMLTEDKQRARKQRDDKLTMATFETVSLAPDVIAITSPLSDKEMKFYGKRPCPCVYTLEELLRKAAKNGLQSLTIDELRFIHKHLSEASANILERLGQKAGVLKPAQVGDRLYLLRRIAELEGDLLKKQKQTQQKIAEMQNAVKLEKDRLTELRQKLEIEKKGPRDIPKKQISRDVEALETMKNQLELRLNEEIGNKIRLEKRLTAQKSSRGETPVRDTPSPKSWPYCSTTNL